MRGRVTERCDPQGQVWVKGQRWSATADRTLERNDPVEVTRVEGLRLHVAAVDATEAPDARDLHDHSVN